MPTDPLPAWVITRRQAIGGNIRTARKVAGLTQETLGERVGLDRKTVSRIENGTHATLLDHLLLVADAIGVPLAELVR